VIRAVIFIHNRRPGWGVAIIHTADTTHQEGGSVLCSAFSHWGCYFSVSGTTAWQWQDVCLLTSVLARASLSALSCASFTLQPVARVVTATHPGVVSVHHCRHVWLER
jgi:hypothetical protein